MFEMFKKSEQIQKDAEKKEAEKSDMQSAQFSAVDKQGVPHIAGSEKEAVQKALEANEGNQ